MFKANHFYLVFNPMINQEGAFLTQAHEFYSELKNLVSQNPGEDNFLYWGKLKVNNQQDKRFEIYQSLINANSEQGVPTHLYISDFHHFWVAKVESVHKEIYNKQKTLSFYDDKDVAVWFKISDMDLVSSEFEETLFYLSQLESQSKNKERITPYLGNLTFPVIVEDHNNENYFKQNNYEAGLRVMKSNPLIETPTQATQLKAHMKSFVLSPQVYSSLGHQAKKELLNVELKISKCEYEHASELHDCFRGYLNVFNSVLNQTLGQIMKDYYGQKVFIDPQSLELSANESKKYSIRLSDFHGDLSLKTFSQIFSENDKLGNISYLPIMEKFPEQTKFIEKNVKDFIHHFELDLKHSAIQQGERIQVTKQEVISIRNQILGVGCVGVINHLIEFMFAFEENYYPQKAS